MTFRQIMIAGALLIGCLNAGCRSFPYMVGLKRVSLNEAAPPIQSPTPADHVTNQVLATGRAIFVSRCARCHPVIPVREFARDEWMNSIIPRMAPRANLTADESQWLRYYIETTLNGLSTGSINCGVGS